MAKKKAIAVIIADTHMKEDNIAVVKSVFREARILAESLKLNTVFHAGDVFNSRKGQVIPNLSAFREVLDYYEANKMQLVVIPGNHDKTDYKSVRSFLDPFARHPALDLISTSAYYTVSKGVTIHLVPFFHDEQYVEHLRDMETLNVDYKNVLLTHIGLDGAKMNNGSVVKSKINRDLFLNFDKVLIGHYHDPATYGNIEYIGAALQHNFGEKPNKGATVLYDDLSTELVEFTFPKYLAYEVSADDLNVKDIEELKLTAKESGNNLRVVLTGSEASIKAVDKQRLKNAGIDVTTKQDAINAEEIEESVIAHTDLSIIESFKVFCEKNNLEVKEGLKYLNQGGL